jgi:ATP-dependent DNA helicase RecG
MFLRSILNPVTDIPKVGPKTEGLLARLGITNIAGLLLHYPRDWEDRIDKNPLSGYREGKVCTTATVITREYVSPKHPLKAYIEDESARAALVCFNQPWLEKVLTPGTRINIFGSFKLFRGEIQSTKFKIEKADISKTFGRLLPVYRLTDGLTQNELRKFIAYALRNYAVNLENEMPAYIIERDALLGKREANKAFHFPSSYAQLELARKTLIYEELFYLEIMVGKRAIERRRLQITKNVIAHKEKLTPFQRQLLTRLPFKLTTGQLSAVTEINSDMAENGPPMARLLQGDVGSGKTLVSFLAALKALERGGQAAIMAPTELLARQHAENAAKILEPLGARIAFLTGNIKAAGRRQLLQNLKEGNIDIIVGTHALFSKDVEYKNLKLVVIDEQHRFGVTQRALIMSKGASPGLLMMSATPIPRSLALTVFGDMDVSVIKDMPGGRKPVITHLARQSNEKNVYDFIRAELSLGHQAYFVYPLIDEGENIKDAVSMAQRLSKEIFPQYRVEVIHSKVPEDQKQRTMDDFRKGDINILAATSVVEVGVDVPNATCMVVEHADRFGLSALHQLRGRVGRGQAQSYCFLIYSNNYSDDGKKRLLIMLKNHDGFVIAEEDLKLRGPGQITGTEQSGYFKLGLANPVRDIQELILAQNDAFGILDNDPDLLLENNRVIARVLDEAPPFCEVIL